ncbi:MAG: demethylmenaquinone methyltransferase/2-methoxy-6-polyprenyl-1,4-benzoquinol methylase [Myxococcota bacterium]|jgi:demethylmenaquinone methyltransferase/2-methoxy-6-polyprenyl-1,4-benzoquinol methylase
MSTAHDKHEADGSGRMFDGIAKRYDLMNRLISFGLDKGWRRRLVAALEVTDGDHVLDLATGTADVAIEVAQTHPGCTVTGVDPSTGMLDVGREKIQKLELTERVRLDEGDAQAMSFADDTFASSCISFGIRNVPDRIQGLREMARVTRPGGRVVVLELGEPRSGIMAPLARFHVHTVVPALGSWLSGSDEYQYLQESIAAFPEPEVFATLMTDVGLTEVDVSPQSFGAAHLYTGRVPAA